MVNYIKGSENGYTFDTCVGIKISENPNLINLLKCHLNIEKSDIHLTSQTVFEASRLGHNFDHVSKQIQTTFGVNVIQGHITKDMQDDSDYLENICPTLHTGDSQILAYTRSTGTTLVTCDRGLTEAAISSGVQVINPDLLLCNKFENNIKSKIQVIAKQVRVQPIRAKQEMISQLLKPGKKIIWRSFV